MQPQTLYVPVEIGTLPEYSGDYTVIYGENLEYGELSFYNGKWWPKEDENMPTHWLKPITLSSLLTQHHVKLVDLLEKCIRSNAQFNYDLEEHHPKTEEEYMAIYWNEYCDDHNLTPPTPEQISSYKSMAEELEACKEVLRWVKENANMYQAQSIKFNNKLAQAGIKL